MFDTIREKISSVVHRHREHHPQTTEEVVTHNVDAVSNSWDYKIIFRSAKGVAVGDIITSDPYLAAYLGPVDDPQTLSFVTGVHWNTLNPEWQAEWNLAGVPNGTVLEMYVKDKDRAKADTALGKATLTLGGELEGTREHELELFRDSGRQKGKLFIQTIATRSAGATAALTKATSKGPVRYSRHTSYAAGVLTQESKFEFYAYRLHLNSLLDVFGSEPSQYQHWNTNYDAAKRIFGDNLEGQQVRSALHSQHSYLYRHRRTTQYGGISHASELGQLLHGDRLKKDPEQNLTMVVFTYSIVPKGMYFSETGAAFFQDFMSKHAMHSNRSTEVMYSGEFRLFQDPHHNHDWTLMIDNNSGTYSPKKEDLWKVQKIFQLNFPDLVVVGLDHEDEQLKEIRAETKKVEAAIAEQQKQRFSLFGRMGKDSEEKSDE
ncbi:hypothetical protein B0O80DRAFT_435126 [Mortierella sp. GBAus27b]|nr:hypothetical protein BGX31_004234 [Mortierella sp. GBA43]KAI8362135.1 hypothetical protein B0O80DRAFT_435126 [Mortierella sp. GBAus27b]